MRYHFTYGIEKTIESQKVPNFDKECGQMETFWYSHLGKFDSNEITNDRSVD